MNGIDNLIFSNNLCCAFLAEIVEAYQSQVGDQHYLGRTAIQKLTYFSKVLGVPIPCSFELYTYGPYSETVTLSMESLLADDVLVDTSYNSKYSNYRLGENGTLILSRFRNALEPYRAAIETLVRVLGKFKPNQLELVATVHFVHQRLKSILGRLPTEAEVIAEFKKFKQDKFENREIKIWYKALADAKLI